MVSVTSRAVALVSVLALGPGCGSPDAKDDESAGSEEASSETGEASTGETSSGDGDGDGDGDTGLEWEVSWWGREDLMDAAYGMAATADGGAVVVGEGWPSETAPQLISFMRKYDAKGSLVWEVPGPQNGNNDIWSGVVEDEDGTLLLVGRGGPPGSNGSYLRLARASSEGELLWEAYAPEADNDYGGFQSVTVDPADGSIYAAGVRDSPDPIAILRKYDPNGVELWRHEVDGDLPFEAPDMFRGIALAPNGDVVVGGTLSSTLEDGGQQALVQRLDSSGQVQWEYRFDGSGDLPDAVDGVAVSPDDQVLFVGRSSQVDGRGVDALVGRLAADGSELWVETRHSAEAEGCVERFGGCDGMHSVVRLDDLNYVTAGYRVGAGAGDLVAYPTVIDPAGAVLWSREREWTREGQVNDYPRICDKAVDGGLFFMGRSRLVKYTLEY